MRGLTGRLRKIKTYVSILLNEALCLTTGENTMKLNLKTLAVAAALLVAPFGATAQTVVPVACPVGYVDGGIVIDAAGNQQQICTPDPSSTPAAPVLVNLHGLGLRTIDEAEMVMEVAGALRISAENLRPGRASRAALLNRFGDMWLYRPGQARPSLLIAIPYRGDLEAVRVGGEIMGVSYQANPGGRVTWEYPEEGCPLTTTPGVPDLWLCLVPTE